MRLIDADMLQVHILSLGHRWDIDNADYICEVIENQSTVNAEPIRHGYWIPVNPDVYGAEQFECSVCGVYSGDGLCRKELDYEYCPNCGAKMDEVE